MKIVAITFDLDNTLWDVEPALLRAEQAQREWLLQHRPGSIEAFDHETLWEFKKSLWKRHPELIHHVSNMRIRMLYELQRAAGYDEAEARAGATKAFAAFLAERHRVELYEEALEILQLLARDYRLGALTNGNADIYKTDAGEYFDFAFLAEEIGASKPAPDIFHAAIALTGLEPGQIVHVGDNPDHDIVGAQSVGMRTVWINPRGLPWTEDAPAPDGEVHNLKQLPRVIAGLALGNRASGDTGQSY
ncbi:phosphatase [Kineobactrum sediminis]|uniref:Phosphatase n=1 Tax=Kineobactrum sediminis TaxID=1905677 RepID=A0A2N5Y6Z7_9GAMM|nr:HAD family hydrolase [Kineobactrum sediminis]PLW84164.1 phosphatase [Kineobactrum sediminis]